MANVIEDQGIPMQYLAEWDLFRKMMLRYDIYFTHTQDNKISFDRNAFFKMLDLFTLLYNNMLPMYKSYVQGFRTEHLQPVTHLFNTFIIFEDRYDLEVTFDDNGQSAYFMHKEFINVVRDMLGWYSYGGRAGKLCLDIQQVSVG